jgi:hypothetical protein
MPAELLDISESLDWAEDLPRPRWDLITTWIENRVAQEERAAAWVAVGRQWLEKLGAAFGGECRVEESEHFLLLLMRPNVPPAVMLPFAEECRQVLLDTLPDIADFRVPGKHIVLAFRTAEDYYRYIAPYYPEGQHGGSGGVQIREGYAHIAMRGGLLDVLQHTLAHEMAHFSLCGLSLPLWVEEGLTQRFAHSMTSRAPWLVDDRTAQRHKRYWGKHGLEEFWRGTSFHTKSKVCELSYQLAEVLVRLLIEEHRPRWFGWDKTPQRRFHAFLREAQVADCGEGAARAHLGFGLGELAARFLGPGGWNCAW